ncbi:NAD(P)-dependent oxidoreductase [Burkholderia gladioli]|uniref:NAD(P)-dependent oxidoreductase n=1 Tax=Burkholderia gladioli TaxID=28095 RepID=UPI001640F3D0|nr:NAD(P)-dependent oxidoreductase [Burkholderia gladioli]
MTQPIGFAGLGAMGWPMAACLVKATHDVVVHDARFDRAAKFAREFDCRVASSGRELAVAPIIITMLPNSDAVEAVLFGEDGAAYTMTPGGIVIDMSSGVPSRTMHIAERLAALGIELVDAPVSGGVRRAERADLTIMTGGREEVISRVTPVLRALGREPVHVGSIGAGHAMKALNNLSLAGGFLIALEAVLIGKKFGLDPDRMIDVLNASSGMNYNTQTKFKPFLLSGTYAAGFSLDLLVKDVGIAADLASELAADVPFTRECLARWKAALIALGPGCDHTEIARVAAELASVAFP